MSKYKLKKIVPVKDSAYKAAVYSIEGMPDKEFVISPHTAYQDVSPEERDEAFDILAERQKQRENSPG